MNIVPAFAETVTVMNIAPAFAETVTVMVYGTERTIGRGPSPGPEGATGPRRVLYQLLKAELEGTGVGLDFVGSKSEGVRSASFDTDWEGLEGPSFRLDTLVDSIGSVLAPYPGLDYFVATDPILWDAFFDPTPEKLVDRTLLLLNAVHTASPGTKVFLGNSPGDIFRSPFYATYNNMLATAVSGMSWVTLINLYVFPSGSFMSQLLLNQEALDRIGTITAEAMIPHLHSAPVPVPSAVWLLCSALVLVPVVGRRRTNA